MMYRPIVLVLVWSLIFIEIDSMPPHTESETNLKDAIREHFDMELNLLNVVELYYKNINEQLSSSSSEITGKPDDREAVALIQASFFTFWMAVTLRIYYEYNSCIYTNEPEEKYDLYFSEMMFAFTEFKKEIKKYYKSDTKNTKSKSAVIDADDNRDITVQEAASMILGLSLEFVSSESTLKENKPDKHRDGIIRWNLLEKHQIKNKSYKTVFPSCLIIRRNFHKQITIKHKKIYWNSIREGINPPGRIDLLLFYEGKPLKHYSNETYWRYIIQDLKNTYRDSYNFGPVNEEIFSFLVDMVRRVIDLSKVRCIQDFLVALTFGGNEITTSVKQILRNRAWILSSLEDSSSIWNTVLQQNFVNNGISTQERIQNVIAVVRSIRDVDKISNALKEYFQ